MKHWRKKIRNFKDSNEMVSEIVGTVLLLGITVAIFSSLYVMVFSYPSPPSPTFVNLVGTVEGSSIIIEHRGGEPLSLETKVVLTIGDEIVDITVGDGNYLDGEAKKDNQWNVGERVVYPFEYNSSCTTAELLAVDGKSSSVVMIGTLDIRPECDIGVEISVDDPFPEIGDNVAFTIKVNHYRGDMTGTDIQIEYILPEGLTHITNTSSHGNYNDETGIWSFGDLAVGESATLTIIATVTSAEIISKPTQLVMILDGSTSISPTDWIIMKNGLATAIKDPDSFPHDGSAELTVIQFGGYYGGNPNAKVELGPIVVNETNYDDVADDIEGITQMKGWTPTACGIALAIDTIETSDNFNTHRHVTTLVTDGQPNAVYNIEDGDYRMEIGSWGTDPEDYENGRASAVVARDYLIDKLGCEDEFDAIAVGNGSGWYPGPDIIWLRDSIVWPNGYEAPPFDQGPGWVRHVDDYQEFADTIDEEFRIIFGGIVNGVKIMASTPIDINAENNFTSITIVPQES